MGRSAPGGRAGTHVGRARGEAELGDGGGNLRDQLVRMRPRRIGGIGKNASAVRAISDSASRDAVETRDDETRWTSAISSQTDCVGDEDEERSLERKLRQAVG